MKIVEVFCSDKEANAEKIKLLNEEYDKLNNDELLVVKGILEKSELNPFNIERKNHIIKIIKESPEVIKSKLLLSTRNHEYWGNLDCDDGVVLNSMNELESLTLSQLEWLLELIAEITNRADFDDMQRWFNSIDPKIILDILDDELDFLNTEQVLTIRKVKNGEMSTLTIDDLKNFRAIFDLLGYDSEVFHDDIGSSVECFKNLEIMESKYTLPKYCVTIHSAGLAADKFAGNMRHRIAEIKKVSKANRILSASINGDLSSKKVYSRVETDSKCDYLKLLHCEWPAGSFGSGDQVRVEREYIGFKLELTKVDKSIKLEREADSIKKLKELGLRNITRVYKIDFNTQEETITDRVSFNVKDLTTLKMVLTDMVPIECTKQTHQVAPFIERVKNCKNCQSYDHGTKQCREPPLCGKCSSTEHNVSACQNRNNMKCCHCRMKHEAGTSKCRVYFSELYKKNEFIIRFMMDECGAATPYAVLNVPVPDGMSIDDDNIGDLATDTEKEVLFDYLDAYLVANRADVGNDELRSEVESLKKITKVQGSKIDALEINQESLVSEIKTLDLKFTGEINNLYTKVDTVRSELSNEISQVRDDLTGKIDALHHHLSDLKDDLYDRLDSMQDSSNANAAGNEQKLDNLELLLTQVVSKLTK